MDIVNRSPDEVKEREFETTGYQGGTDLPEREAGEGVNENNEKSASSDVNRTPEKVADESTGINKIDRGVEQGSDIKSKDQTAGIP